MPGGPRPPSAGALDVDEVEADWQDDAYSVQPERVLERAELRDELEEALHGSSSFNGGASV